MSKVVLPSSTGGSKCSKMPSEFFIPSCSQLLFVWASLSQRDGKDSCGQFQERRVSLTVSAVYVLVRELSDWSSLDHVSIPEPELSDWSGLDHVSIPEPITVARWMMSSDWLGLGHMFPSGTEGTRCRLKRLKEPGNGNECGSIFQRSAQQVKIQPSTP